MTVDSHLERGKLPPCGMKQLFEAVAKDFEAQKKAYENIEGRNEEALHGYVLF